jgi:transcriptional regulator with XRE-family HTH domain
VVTTCLECGVEVVVKPGETRPGKFCKPEHMDKYRRLRRPWNDLQTRCFRYMGEHGLNVAQFARQSGIPPNTFRSWLRNKGRPTSRANLAALARMLDIPEEQAIAEAGGVTADDVRSHRGGPDQGHPAHGQPRRGEQHRYSVQPRHRRAWKQHAVEQDGAHGGHDHAEQRQGDAAPH